MKKRHIKKLLKEFGYEPPLLSEMVEQYSRFKTKERVIDEVKWHQELDAEWELDRYHYFVQCFPDWSY